MAKRSVKINFVYQAAYQILMILIPLVTTPYLSRVLGAEGVGMFSYTQAVTYYFVMVGMLGMSTYGVREIAAAGDDRQLRSKTFWSAYASQIIVSSLSLVAYIVYLLFLDPAGGFVVTLVWGLYVVSALLDVTWLLFGVEEFKIPTIRSVATKLATLVVIFGFVKSPSDLWLYCLAIAGSFFANQVLIWPFVKRYVNWSAPKWTDVKRHFKPNLVLFIPVVAISLYTSMDKILLGSIAGMEQAGFFEYSDKLSKMPMAVITAMGTVMLPRMASQLSSGNRDGALNLLEDSIWAMLAMSMALAFGIMAIAPEFAPVFLGEEFASCDVIMAVIAIVIPMIATTNVIGRQYLVPTGRDAMYTASVCIGAVVNIAVNLALIPRMGALGAAIATVAAEGAVLVAQSWSVRGELPLSRYAKNAVPFLAIGLIMAGVIRLSAGLFNELWGMAPLGLALEVVVGVIVFSALALVWCVMTRNEHFQKLLPRR
ncbi:MAG: flippase [Eggerthellaceae bacterium]|nr:flippase [Eggerthellaceae bacterium]